MKLDYDESGESVLYFILSLYTCILLPATYFLWPKVEESQFVPLTRELFDIVANLDQYQLLQSNVAKRKRRARRFKIGLCLAWIFLLFLIYRVSAIEITDKEYDPFAVLNVDREASLNEIKRAYHELGGKHHPDRGGDPEQFKTIAKAYRTLTNEEARDNWRKYGNPDGQRTLRLGVAIPKWFVERENAVLVLMLYTGSFMIVLSLLFLCFSN